MSKSALLSVRDLWVSASGGSGGHDILRGVSFDVDRGEKVGIVGESGSGKSMTALSLLRLLPRAIRIRSGAILFEGTDLVTTDDESLRTLRGADVSMVFQDPMTALNPVRRIERQLTEGMAEHLSLTRAERRDHALQLMRRVKIPRPEQILGGYSHQLSGGMRQRIAIAMALACRPKLLVADEPTTALDVTVQSEVMALLRELTNDRGTAVILISHSLDLVADFCDRILVMYAGKVVEAGSTADVIRHPQHPYTADLLASSPDIRAERLTRFAAIAGQPPAAGLMPEGCAYHPRCRLAYHRCEVETPQLDAACGQAACFLAGDKLIRGEHAA